MRQSIDIPEGDLFTVMETWDDGDRIQKSMDVILEIEAVAAAQSQAMPGFYELIDFLAANPHVKVGLVTRNTEESMSAFFNAVGASYKDAFDLLMTREFAFVKPDKRCLMHFSQAWGIPPERLLMVGDSTEDIECGNAAGLATCLIRGGGNEVNAGKSRPPTGSVETFAVDSLHELLDRLVERNTPLGYTAISDEDRERYAAESSSEEEYEVVLERGAPPPGLGFFDWMFESGVVQPPACSFPRILASRNRNTTDDHPGARVLHLGCGDGALTKMMFSSGLNVVGVDVDACAAKARKRGLATASIPHTDVGSPEFLRTMNESSYSDFDAIAYLEGDDNDSTNDDSIPSFLVLNPTALSNLKALVTPHSGVIAIEVSRIPGVNKTPGEDNTRDVCHELASAAGLTLAQFEHLDGPLPRYRLVFTM